ncbi:MCE family protein [Mycolicibacterium sp.]|uniref:MCE family protein n=1 Tax=Mycolicibacterium sp. TaxID=2320850 RepID=UPI003D139E0F
MHLQRRIRIQFAIFVVIALGATSILIVGYGRLGTAWFGAGHYTVTIDLPESAGLYDRANVTYRGSTVGRVEDVALTDSAVRAVLSIRKGFDIPADVTADVHSQTAIGEQYVALVPAHTTDRLLSDGDVIPMGRTTVPPDINDQLDMTSTALRAIPNDNLRTAIDESYTALGGLGSELNRIIEGANDLVIKSRANLDDLTNVIDNSGPVLDSQIDSSDDVSAWATHMAILSGQVQRENPAVSELLVNAGPATDKARALFDRLNPSVPVLLANLVSFSDIGIVYNPNLEQILVLIPQVVAQLGSTYVSNMNTKQDYKGQNQQATLNINLPPPCLTGYLPPAQRRSPALVDYPERPDGDFYCRIPQDSPHNVRGARNIPCPGKPWRRAPLVWMCENDIDYVPLNDGNNWKGDPNATLSGQDVPQLPPGAVPAGQVAVSPDGRPPVSTPVEALAILDYNPADGTYLGPDGVVYTQGNLAGNGSPPTLQAMLLPPVPSP